MKNQKSSWPFEVPEPQWYSNQTIRWNKLASKGWRFSFRRIEGSVTLGMERKNVSIEFSVPESWSFRTVHTWFMERCEEFARAKVRKL